MPGPSSPLQELVSLIVVETLSSRYGADTIFWRSGGPCFPWPAEMVPGFPALKAFDLMGWARWLSCCRYLPPRLMTCVPSEPTCQRRRTNNLKLSSVPHTHAAATYIWVVYICMYVFICIFTTNKYKKALKQNKTKAPDCSTSQLHWMSFLHRFCLYFKIHIS